MSLNQSTTANSYCNTPKPATGLLQTSIEQRKPRNQLAQRNLCPLYLLACRNTRIGNIVS